MNAADMQLNNPSAYEVLTEVEVLDRHLQVREQRLLELGCGRAWMTRLLAEQFGPAALVATEVDRIQHAKNLAIPDLPQVSFQLGGAEAIAAPDQSFDLVLMFKSLHHVPGELLDQALAEIHRVLRPGGRLYVSEPVYWGDFNEILRLFNDEQQVRQRAFTALRTAVESGLFALEAEVFFQVPGTYESWERFEELFLQVTHTELHISPPLYERIRAAFMAHMTPSGASFLKPHRADILRRPA
jgi:SAM-dependent methyltransferase